MHSRSDLNGSGLRVGTCAGPKFENGLILVVIIGFLYEVYEVHGMAT